jgi:glycerol uptake facilitator-like aquaporin|eukprot:scaffold1342_cov255-Chaetoceros_neogracile.AAC.3
MFSLISSLVTSFSENVPPGLLLTLLVVPISNFKHMKTYFDEFVGTILMIGFTFSPGKWNFADALYMAWAMHSLGVIAADKIGGGQHVNPAMSVAMFSLGKCDYTEMCVRIAGAMGGGLVAFPLFKAMTDVLGWTELGGPEFNADGDEDGSAAAWSEFTATMLLGFLIYIVNWELNFGKHHYWIKQSLTAFGIRALIEVFPTAGPAINPMLGTTWAVFAYGGFPEDVRHYLVYWVASILGALVSAFAYAVYDGCDFLGTKLPIGPIKKKPEAKTEAKKKKN